MAGKSPAKKPAPKMAGGSKMTSPFGGKGGMTQPTPKGGPGKGGKTMPPGQKKTSTTRKG